MLQQPIGRSRLPRIHNWLITPRRLLACRPDEAGPLTSEGKFLICSGVVVAFRRLASIVSGVDLGRVGGRFFTSWIGTSSPLQTGGKGGLSPSLRNCVTLFSRPAANHERCPGKLPPATPPLDMGSIVHSCGGRKPAPRPPRLRVTPEPADARVPLDMGFIGHFQVRDRSRVRHRCLPRPPMRKVVLLVRRSRPTVSRPGLAAAAGCRFPLGMGSIAHFRVRRRLRPGRPAVSQFR